MKIGIIGAGFTGLSAGYYLSKKGFDVTIIESDKKPGGLAVGFRKRNWDWALEAHYHHWFKTDWPIIKLAKEINHEIDFIKAKTSTYYNKNTYQLDSAQSLLLFKEIPFIDRLRTGVVLAYLRFTPLWKPLTKVTAYDFITRYMGQNSYKVLWGPLFKSKFGEYEKLIPASWFWARIKKRSVQLGYPGGGYQKFADNLVSSIKKQGGKLVFSRKVEKIEKRNDYFIVDTNEKSYKFDKLISTLPTSIFTKITKGLPKSYVDNLLKVKWIGAVSTILFLKEEFFKDGTYWLNMNDTKFPFLALIEHTNLLDNRHYGNENILYIANYKGTDHEYFKLSERQLAERYIPYLKRINPEFDKSWIEDIAVFKSPIAQPILPVNYLDFIPKLSTPVNNLFLANMQLIYPWDRGTNFSVEMGKKVSDLVINSNNL